METLLSLYYKYSSKRLGKLRTKPKVMHLGPEMSVKTVLSSGQLVLILAFPFTIPFHCPTGDSKHAALAPQGERRPE